MNNRKGYRQTPNIHYKKENGLNNATMDNECITKKYIIKEQVKTK